MKKVLVKIYLFAFFGEFMLIYPFYMLMFEDYGLSPVKISLLLTVWAISVLVLEVPSGALADRFSRKWVIISAQCFKITAFSLWVFFPSFIGFFLGFLFWGIKEALASGTFEALIYDELKESGKEKQYLKVLGRIKGIVFISVVLAALIGSGAIKLGYRFVLLMSILSIIIATSLILFLPEAKSYKKEKKLQYREILKKGLFYSVKTPRILPVLLFISCLFGLAGTLEEFWPLFAKEIGIKKQYISLIYGLAYGAMAAGSLLSHYFEKVRRKYIYLLFMFSGFCVLAAGIFYNTASIVLLLVFFIIYQVCETYFQSLLQGMIPSRVRATISSISSLISATFAMILFMLFGIISRAYNYRYGFLFYAVLVLILSITYLLLPLVNGKITHGNR
jgi:MFS family permease